jgi:hypothetical protein
VFSLLLTLHSVSGAQFSCITPLLLPSVSRSVLLCVCVCVCVCVSLSVPLSVSCLSAPCYDPCHLEGFADLCINLFVFIKEALPLL